MNEAQWTALDAYVVDIAQRMRLGNWHIRLLREHCDNDSNATVFRYDDKHEADVRVVADFAKRTPGQQRYTITHELLHLFLVDMSYAVDLAKPTMGDGIAWTMLTQAHSHAEEYAADGIAQVLSPFMPPCELPPEEGAQESSPPS